MFPGNALAGLIAAGFSDDVAVLHFHGLWRLPDDEVEEWRQTEVWRLVDGRWRQWAGHATPVDDDDQARGRVGVF